MIAKFHL